MNCPSVGPAHGVQSSRNRLLQCGSPRGSQALSANLLQRGLLSPWGHRSWQEPTPTWVPHGVTASFRHLPALVWGPPRAAGGDLLHCGPPWAAGAQPASPWSSPWAGAPPPPPSALILVSAELALPHIFTPRLQFFPFLNVLSQRCYHCR